MAYTSAIIGLGNIGFGYDRDLPEKKFNLSHSRALSNHPDFELIAGIDANTDLTEAFSHRYGTASSSKIDDLLAQYKPEIIVNATPTELHLPTIKNVLSCYTPKAILCEKPLSYDSKEAIELVHLCAEANSKLYVNFLRRADPGILYLKNLIKTAALDLPFEAYVEYTKGLLHNGSHFADLFCFLFGPIQDFGGKIHDGQIIDKDGLVNVDFCFEHGRVTLKYVDKYSNDRPVFECYFSNGYVNYYKDGTIELSYNKDLTASGIDSQPTRLKIDSYMNHYQYHVLNQLSAAMKGHKSSLCTGYQALATQFWLNKAIGDLQLEK